MKNLLLTLFSVLSLSLAAQNSTVTVTVNDSSGSPIHGVSVFFYTSSSQFFANGAANGPVVENFATNRFTNSSGVATLNLWNPSVNDTVFWAAVDCAGNLDWGAGMVSVMSPNLNGTLNLNCIPGDCDAIFRTDSFNPPGGGTTYLVEAFPLREFTQTNLPSNIPSYWTVNGTGSSGFSASNYDSLMFSSNNFSAPYNITFARVDSACTTQSLSIGGGGSNPNPVSCSPSFWADTLGQTASGYAMAFRNNSSSNGSIINYSWDFGDGNTASGLAQSNPTHTYVNSGVYAVCLTMTAVLGNDTCTSTYCDSSVFVPSGSTGGGQISCAASYMVDTVNSSLFQNQLIIWESSYSNGNIISYSWDFGDGTTINTQYPSHTYTNTGVYNVCLSITAIDSAGIDTCVSTFCDSVGFDANGNLVYKAGQNGFTINVIDPATVGIEDLLLNESLSMYPNPANEKVTLSWDSNLKVEKVKVFSITGQQVRSVAVSGDELEIRDLPGGAYLVRVESATASKTLRLIVE